MTVNKKTTDPSVKERAKRIVEYVPQIMKSLHRAVKLGEECTEFEKLHFQHYQILKIISLTPNCSTNDIKNMLMLAQSTVSQHITKLLKEKMIKIEYDEDDRRKTCITLSDTGKEALDKRMKVLVEKHTQYLLLLDEPDRELFEESFKNLVKIAKKIEEKTINQSGDK